MDLSPAHSILLKDSMTIRVGFWKIKEKMESNLILSVLLVGELKDRKNTGEPVTLGEASGAKEEILEYPEE